MTRLIGPESLEADAVVPQCLDNQFVSDETFELMLRRGLDYTDSAIKDRRKNAFRNEFVRSLVYSSQVVIQRAYFTNSDFLYENYLPTRPKDLEAFAQLVRSGAIVPFLFTESSLSENLQFDLSSEGRTATRTLLEELADDVTCVRLSPNDVENRKRTAQMSTEFGHALTRFRWLDDESLNAMAVELFRSPDKLHSAGFERFGSSLQELAKTAFAMDSVTRNELYKKYFAFDGRGEHVAAGRFRSPSEDEPFLFELKKLVDLAYNVNLPDHLGRYTFTPLDLPSRMALQDAPGTGYTHEQISSLLTDDDMMEQLRRAVAAHTQRAMSLPLLANLTTADVIAIRALPEWDAFRLAQARLLKNPLEALENFAQFESAFEEFQASMSDWYQTTYHRQRTEDRYCNFVSIALSIGGRTIIAGSGLSPVEKAVAGEAAARVIPQRVKGYAAKLMVGVYDLGRRRLDSQRSYTIELMQTNEELLKEDVEGFLHKVTGKAEEPLPPVDGLIADQGIR